jgi:hypothetical protein
MARQYILFTMRYVLFAPNTPLLYCLIKLCGALRCRDNTPYNLHPFQNLNPQQI